MKKLFVIAAVLGALWYHFGPLAFRTGGGARPVATAQAAPTVEANPAGPFHCDGRIYCSQMTSCAEATFFLQNCPGVKLDGNHDGVPCEQQWCR